MGAYNDLFDDEPAVPAAPGPARPYADLFEDNPRPNMLVGVQANPDEQAERQRLAKRYNIPPEIADETFKARAKLDDANAAMERAPALRSWIAADGARAKVAHDDVENLSAIEQAMSISRRYSGAAVEGLVGQTAGGTLSGLGELYDVAARGLGSAISAVTPAAVGDFLNTPIPEWLDPSKVFLKAPGQVLKDVGRAAGPAPEERTFGTDVAAGLGQMAGQIATAILTGGTASAGMLFAQGADVMAEKTAEDEATQAEKDVATVLGAAWTGITEKYGLDKLLNRVPPAMKNAALRKIADVAAGAGIEAAQEVAEGLGQDIIRKLTTNAQAEIGQGVLDEASVAGTVGGIVRAALGVRARGGRAEQATREAEALTEVSKLAEVSKVRERSPDDFASFMQTLAAEGQVPPDVFIDARELDESTLRKLVEASPAAARQAAESLASGTDMQIPVAEFGASVAGQPFAAAVVPHLKTDPNGMSKAQAEAADADQDRAAMVDAIGRADQQDAFERSRGALEARFLEQLNATGRFTPEVNRPQAALLAARYAALGSRLGITPEQAFEQLPVTIGTDVTAGALEQITPEQAKDTNVPVDLPVEPLFAEAVQNTPDAQVTSDGLLIDLVRFQKPEQEGAQAIRTGVFYLPAKSANAKHYKTTPTTAYPNPYGGTEKMTGPTLLRRPLFVKGATGGKAPEAAYDAIKGKGAMKALDRAVMEVVNSKGILSREDPALFEENVQRFLRENGGEPGLAWEIIANSKQGNTLRYALQEHVIAHAVRAAGYDSVLGYSKGKTGAFLSEVFDVREQTYPSDVLPAQVHAAFNQPAYHGSPHRGIEQFTTQKIGTGEGAQAYGWGLYFAQSKDIAEFYRRTLSGTDFEYSTPAAEAAMASATNFASGAWAGISDAFNSAGGDPKRAAEIVLRLAESARDSDLKHAYATAAGLIGRGEMTGVASGQLYEVEVPDDADMLDYDAALKDQPEKVRKGLAAAGVRVDVVDIVDRSGSTIQTVDTLEDARREIKARNLDAKPVARPRPFKGKWAYEQLTKKHGSPEAASRALFAAGIPGLRYLDAGSRGAQADRTTRNYVIFDDSAVKKTGEFYQTIDQTQTPEFKAWFDDSKVVDAQGRPLVVYHSGAFDETADPVPRVGDEGFHFGTKAAADQRDIGKRVDDFIKSIVVTEGETEDGDAAWFWSAEGMDSYDLDPDGFPSREAAQADAERLALDQDFTDAEPMPQTAAYLSIKNPKRLTDQKNDWTAAVAQAKAEGHDGIVYRNMFEDKGSDSYIVFSPEQIKSAIGNRGTFDPNDPSILAQGGARGQYSPDTQTIALLKDANLSTFIHESGHLFLDQMGALAVRDDAPASIREDMQTLLDWFGVQGTETGLGKATKPINYAEAADLLRGKTEKPGGTDPTQHLSERARYRIGRVPLEMFADNEEGDRYDGTVDAERAANYAARPGDAAPAVIAAVPRKGGKLRILDGGHRISAARLRGDTHILAVVNVRNTEQTALEAWNAMSIDQQREYHERFARGFEAYALEGKAPSSALAGAFQRFRGWLRRLYRSIRSLDVELTDEVRAVMDRMIATDEEIQQARAAQSMGLMFNEADAKKLGIDYRAYQAIDEEHADDAATELDQRRLRDLKWFDNAKSAALRALQRQARDLRVAVEAEVTAEVDATPTERARRALDEMSAADPETVERLKEWQERRDAEAERARAKVKAEILGQNPDLTGLERAQLINASKAEINSAVERDLRAWDRANPKPRPASLTPADLDAVADQVGFASGEEMLRALAESPRRSDLITAMTDQRMLEQYGDISSREELEQAAIEAVYSKARARVVATELGALEKAAAVTTRTVTKAAQAFAAQVVGRQQVGKLRPEKFEAAARKAAAASLKAFRAGDIAKAATEKRNELVNTYAAREARERKAEIDKKVAQYKRSANKPIKEVAKTRDADLVQAMRAILAEYGIGAKGEAAQKYIDELKAHDPATHAQLADSITALTAGAKDYRETTVDEFRALADDVDVMWALSRRNRQMVIDGDLIEVQEAAAALNAQIVAQGVPARIPGEGYAVTEGEKVTALLRSARAGLRRVESWVNARDDGPQGPFRRYVWNPIKDAADRYRADQLQYLKRYRFLLSQIDLGKARIDAPELGYVFGYSKGGSGKQEILHAILHTGNASNKRKLLLGRGWGTLAADGTLDTSRWDAFVKRMIDTGVLTKADYDFAQGVWDMLEDTKAGAQKTHREVFGRSFDEVTAEAFTTPWGEYRGGYVPALVDADAVSDAKTREIVEQENQSMMHAFPSTPKGFTKGRVEYNRALMLDLRSLSSHIDKVLMFTHLEQPVREVRRVLGDDAVRLPLSRVDSAAYDGMLIPWLSRAARQQVETPVPGYNGLFRYFTKLRSRAGMAAMFANVLNTAQQITGFSLAALRVRPRHLSRALVQYVTNPRQTAERVVAASTYMASRMDNEVSLMNQAIDDILLNPSVYQKAQAWSARHAYFLQAAADNVMGPIIWTGAYNEAIEQGASEADARRQADSAVRETQGSNLPEDVANFEAGKPFVRLFTQFQGYFNMQANLLGTEFAKTQREMGLRAGMGRGLYIFTLGFLAPALVSQLIVEAGRGGPDDEDGDGYLDDWLAALGLGVARSAWALIPVAGPIADVAINSWNNKPYDDKISTAPAISMIEGAARAPVSVYSAAAGEGSARKAVKDVASLISITTGLPAYAIGRPAGYVADVLQGRVAPTGPADAVRGAVTGTPSPESR